MDICVNWLNANKKIMIFDDNKLDKSTYTINLGDDSDFDFNPTTVVIFFYNGQPMFGKFKEVAKDEDYIICDMYKKHSLEYKSRPWRLKKTDVKVVENYGELFDLPYITKLENGAYSFINYNLI